MNLAGKFLKNSEDPKRASQRSFSLLNSRGANIRGANIRQYTSRVTNVGSGPVSGPISNSLKGFIAINLAMEVAVLRGHTKDFPCTNVCVSVY